jgi:uncharacterized protein (UPF0548 family)
LISEHSGTAVYFTRPSPVAIADFLQSQRDLPFTYGEVGATAGQLPVNYNVDHTHIRIGTGEADFLAAQAALRAWRHFALGWVEAWPTTTPLEANEVVAVLARTLGVTWLNAARIVYVVDEDGPVRRFGFAYGTLPGHAERGEERFLIEWDRKSNDVCYDILAFSQPRHPLARLGYPLVRWLQKRFGRHSVAAMRRAVATMPHLETR